MAVVLIDRGVRLSEQRPRAFHLNWSSPQAEGLVAWYPDTSLRSRVNAANPFVAVGGILRGGSSRGEAWNHTGSTSLYLETTDTVYGTMPLTMAGWAYVRNITAAHTLFASADTAGTTNYFTCYARGDLAGDFISAQCSGSGGAVAASSTLAYPQREWFHFCCVFASTTSRTVYLNGAHSATDTTGMAAAPTGLDNTTAGVLLRTSAAQALDGTLDDLRIYNRALTATDAWALYDQATRWELYATASTRTYFFFSTANPVLLRMQTEGLFVGSAH
jgi:hypothetical protein